MDDIAQEIEALSMDKKPEKGTQGNKAEQNAAAPEESNQNEDTPEEEVKSLCQQCRWFQSTVQTTFNNSC